MPELPEVETIRRALEMPLCGRRIGAAEFRLPRLLLADAADTAQRLRGQRIDAVRRRGKYLILELSRDSVIFHLGMTGQLTVAPARARADARFVTTVTGLQKALGAHPVDAHTHALIHLDDGSRLQFRDPRTFGKILFVPGRGWSSHARLRKLGPEPLDLSVATFVSRHFPAASRRPVKALLLDQTFLAGVGNIYADEALFAAGLHPQAPVHTLTRENGLELLRAVKNALRQGIRHQGTSFSDYRKPDGSLGRHYEHLKAYGRGDQPCLRCGTLLVKTVVAQRGSVFCPRCQPVPSGKANFSRLGRR